MTDAQTPEELAAAEKWFRVANKLGKWRTVFAGWQLGTRSATDPEARALRDHRDLSMMLRVECSAIAGLLIAKGVFTALEFTEALIEQAEALDKAYEAKFPGARTTDEGVTFDARWVETARGWRP